MAKPPGQHGEHGWWLKNAEKLERKKEIIRGFRKKIPFPEKVDCS
jgi:hypothetical protein